MRILLLTWFALFALGGFSQNKNRALIIGVSEYKELPKASQLQYADDDALEFYHFIRSKAAGNIDSADVKLLLNENATAAQIWRALDELVDVSKPNDKIIIYFSGHGDIETKTVRQRGFLLAHDSPRAGYQVGGTIKISELQDYLETLVTANKARVILITDACRSGKLAGGEAGASQTTAALNEHWGSITKILSSQAGELSAESEAWGKGHGIFTYNLVRGLWGLADTDGDGWVSLTELNIYLSQEVPKATYNAQHPVISGNLSSKISKVDSKRVAALLASPIVDKNNGGTLLASAKGSFKLDTLSKRLHQNFLNSINEKKFIDSDGSAFAYFKRLQRLNPKNEPFVNELRRLLVAGLEDDVQLVLNRYMNQDQSLNDDDYLNVRLKLDSALTLISQSDFRYNGLFTKRVFFAADLPDCTCDPLEVEDADAIRAVRELKKALTLNPEMPYLHNGLGSAYFFIEKFDSAIFHYRRAIELSPTWIFPINNLGTTYLEQEQYDSALMYFEHSISKSPDHPWAYMQVARLRAMQDHWEEAIKYANKHLEIEPSAYSYYLLGTVYSDMEDYEKAVSSYQTSLEMDPENEIVVENMAEALGILGRFDESKEYYQTYINLQPKSYIGYLGVANADYELENIDLALPNYQRAIKLQPKDATIALYLGDTFQQLSNYDSAMFYYKRSIAQDPTLAQPLHNLAVILHIQKKNTEALSYYLKAASLDSLNVTMISNLGKVYMDLKKYDASWNYLQKALKLDPKYSKAHENLSDYYLKKKDKKLTSYHRAIYFYLEGGSSTEVWTELQKCMKAGYPVKSDTFLIDLLGKEVEFKNLK